MATKPKGRLVDFRHPDYSSSIAKWKEWRMVYEGGDEFIKEYTYRYSKREPVPEYNERVKLTYNPGDATVVLDEVRNAMIAKLPDVVRTGEPDYVEAMKEDVDLYKSSMNVFMGLQILPLLLAQSKRFIAIDAPAAVSRGLPATKADDAGKPYLYPVSCEDVLSWVYDDQGVMNAVLYQSTVDKVDPETGLLTGTEVNFRYMKLLEQGDEHKGVAGPGVVVRDLNKKGDDIAEPTLLKITRIPLVEVRLVESLLRNVSKLAIGLLNLSSSDMAFLFRGNFPIYTEQYDPATGVLKPRAAKVERKNRKQDQEPTTENATRHTNEPERPVGVIKGIRYKKDLDPPGFIEPPTTNLQVSMEKQVKVSEGIRLLATLALASMSTKALEQSGKSKELDRVSLQAGLAYIGSEMQTAEREVARLWHELLGYPNAEYNVQYPEDYRLLTAEERLELAKQWQEAKGTVRSKTFQKSIEKRVAEVLTGPTVDQETTDAINAEIEEAPWFDEAASRNDQVGKDVTSLICDTETAAEIRGYGKEAAQKARANQSAFADLLAMGSVPSDARGLTAADAVIGDGQQQTGDGTDVAGAAAEGAIATGKPVSSVALNGAQIAALQGIINSVSKKELPAEAAKLLIAAGFPSIPQEQVDKMVKEASDFALPTGGNGSRTPAPVPA